MFPNCVNRLLCGEYEREMEMQTDKKKTQDHDENNRITLVELFAVYVIRSVLQIHFYADHYSYLYSDFVYFGVFINA